MHKHRVNDMTDDVYIHRPSWRRYNLSAFFQGLMMRIADPVALCRRLLIICHIVISLFSISTLIHSLIDADFHLSLFLLVVHSQFLLYYNCKQAVQMFRQAAVHLRLVRGQT
jgi:hypothetical protein